MHRSNRSILFFMATGSAIGGVETWLDRMCRASAQSGFDPLIALVRGQKTHRPERFREFHPDLPTVEVDGRGLDREGRVRAAVRCVRRHRPAVVLPLGVIDANDAVIRCKSRGDDVRLVCHAQGNLPPMLADLRDCRDWIDLAVCPGRLTCDVLTDWAGFHARQVRHIPNGADPAIARRPEPDAASPLRLGYVGRFSQGDKRVLDVIDLCARLDEKGIRYSLEMVGDGPVRAELTAGLTAGNRQVRFTGAIPHEEVYRSVLPRLDVLLLFSASEAFGIVLAEAMMNGVVPVTSQYLGYHSEKLVVDGQTGLSFPVGEMAAAAEQVHSLDSNPGLLAELAARCRRHAQRNFTWERSMNSWLNALEEVMERAPQCDTPGRLMPVPCSGRLARMGVAPGLIDWVRRARRRLFGPAVPPGGEEWPLFHRHHSPDSLEEIVRVCERHEQSRAGESLPAAGNAE